MTFSFINVASHLARLASLEPERPALHVPRRRVNGSSSIPDAYSTLTFRELNDLANRLAFGLDCVGVQRGVRTVVMVPPSVEFFALTFALFKLAAVPVLVDPGMGVRNLGKCLAEAEPEAFIGVPKAHLARRLFGWSRKSIRTTVNVGRGRFFCRYALGQLSESWTRPVAFKSPDVSADDTAAILFTSGSTGIAKGVVYTHGSFAAQVEMLKATYGIEPGEVDLCTFPLFALFGPALGMTCVVPDMNPSRPAMIDPRKVVKQIRQFNVTNMFGSPAVVRRLGEHGISDGTKLETLRRVISAGAPVPANAIEAFSKLLPDSTEIFTPYGATESLPVANIGSREILGETRHLTDQGRGICVGRPVNGMTVHVISITDDAIPEWSESLCLPPGQVGEFVVRGPVVTKSYYNRPEQTRLAKIHDPRTGETLHRMGDVGYLDEHGRLWYCGRKSHRVETPHGTLFTEMVEGVFNTVPGVARTALVGVTRGGVTYPVVCGEPDRNSSVGEAMYSSSGPDKFLTDLMRPIAIQRETLSMIETFVVHPWFPVDVRHNAKINREELATYADQRLGRQWNPKLNAQARPSQGVREPTA